MRGVGRLAFQQRVEKLLVLYIEQRLESSDVGVVERLDPGIDETAEQQFEFAQSAMPRAIFYPPPPCGEIEIRAQPSFAKVGKGSSSHALADPMPPERNATPVSTSSTPTVFSTAPK